VMNFKKYNVVEPIALNKLKVCLENWKADRIPLLTNQIELHLKQSQNAQLMCQTILNALIYETGQLSLSWLDLSIFYRTSNGRNVRVISKVALEALRNVIRLRLTPLTRDLDIVSPFLRQGINNDELGRPFERLLLSVLYLSGTKTVKTTTLDFKNEQLITLSVSKGILVNKSLPTEPFVEPVVLIQEDKDFPISDIIFITQDTVIILQLTVGSVGKKIPFDGKVYSAIYNPQKLQSLVRSLHLSIPRQQEVLEGKINYVDSLMSLTIQPFGKINLDPQVQQFIDTKTGKAVKFYYIIVTTQSYSKIPKNTMATVEKQFPWVRVIYREHLDEFFNTDIIALLPENEGFSQ